MTDFVHIRRLVYGEPWAIQPGRLEAIAEVVHRRCVQGVRMSPEEIAGIRGPRQPNGTLMVWQDGGMLAMDQQDENESRQRRGEPTAGPARGASQGTAIAVINCMGIVSQHAAQVDDVSGPGGTSTERVGRALDAALADQSISSIVLNMDSPGGSVYGVQELADKIRAGREQKPIVAQVSGVSASAMYWLAAQCSEIVVQPSGQVGSIGVYALHQDVSKAADEMGFKFTFVSAGKYKVEGNPYEPLQGEAQDAMQTVVDAYYSDFTSAVAKGRGVPVADVRGGFGEGRMVRAADAVKLGMADRVGTLEQTLERLSKQAKGGGKGARADSGTVLVPVAQDEPAPADPVTAPASSAPAAIMPAGLSPEMHALRARRHAHRLRGA